MAHKCTVPMAKEHALIYNSDAVYNKHVCGRDAVYKCEGWYLCEGHKKHLADIEKWPTEPLEEN